MSILILLPSSLDTLSARFVVVRIDLYSFGSICIHSVRFSIFICIHSVRFSICIHSVRFVVVRFDL